MSFMLETMIAILLIAWLAGMTAGATFGGALHACTAASLILFCYGALTNRQPHDGNSRK